MGHTQRSPGHGKGALFCRAPPRTGAQPLGAVSSGLGFSPRCQRAPRLLAGAGVFPACLSPPAGSRLRGQVGFVLISLGPQEFADFNELPLWPLPVRVPATGQPPPPWSCGVSALWAIAGQTLGSTLSLSLEPGKCPRESHFTPPTPGAPDVSQACFAKDVVLYGSQGSVNFTALKVLACF